MARIWNLEPLDDWAVLRLPVGEAARLESMARELGLLVQVYTPMLHVRRRLSRKRKADVVAVEAYPGYAFARGDLESLRHHPQSRFGFVTFNGERAYVSRDQVQQMRDLELRWKQEAQAQTKPVEVPQFAKNERVIMRDALFAQTVFLVQDQTKDAVFVAASGSHLRIKVSPFLLDRIQE